jgi:shikimate kinase
LKPIFIIGFMGAGKTTVGCLLADLLSMQFVDTDAFIEEKLGMSVTEIFAQQGIDFFRKAEKKVLRYLAENQNIIIATGGGAPCDLENLELIKRYGTSFYLKWNECDLLVRLKIDGTEKRPLLAGKTDAQLAEFINTELATRKSFYAQADFTVSGKNDKIIARKIVEKVLCLKNF